MMIDRQVILRTVLLSGTLLASLASPVGAATMVVNGFPDPGAAGADRTDSWIPETAGGPGGDGEAGGEAEALADYATNGDVDNAATAKGGAGGAGGSGGHGRADPADGGDGGAGGIGGNASATAHSDVGWGVMIGVDASAMATATGGRGGAGGQGGMATGAGALSGKGGHGGRGGDATTAASAGIGPDSAVVVSVGADAGDGGPGGLPGAATRGATPSLGGSGGDGGNASLSASGYSAVMYAGFGRSVTVTATGSGGDGGAGFGVGQKGGDGGRADATARSNMGEPGGGAHTVVLLAGGNGGAGAFGAAGGNGGEVRVNGDATNAWDLGFSGSTVTATGGAGGGSDTGRGGDGGVAVVTYGGGGHVADLKTRATGGDGGGGQDGGAGGSATVTSTAGLKYGGRSDFHMEAWGGRGGDASAGGSGGDGGAATSIAEPGENGSAVARAVGGAGGWSGDGMNGGAGGTATARVTFEENRNSPGSNISLSGNAYAEGGAGGVGRNGGDATASITADYGQSSSRGGDGPFEARLEATAIGGAGGPGSGTEQGDAVATISSTGFMYYPSRAERAVTANGRQARAAVSRRMADSERHTVDAISSQDGVASAIASVTLQYPEAYGGDNIFTEARATVARAAPLSADLDGLTDVAVAVALPADADIKNVLNGHPNVSTAFDHRISVLGLSMLSGKSNPREGTTRTDFAIDMSVLSSLPAESRLTVGMLEGSVPDFSEFGSPQDWITKFTIEIDDVVFSYDFSPKFYEEIEEKRSQAMAFVNDNVIDLGPWQAFMSSQGLLEVSYRFDIPFFGDYSTNMIFGINSATPTMTTPLPGAVWLLATAIGVLFVYGGSYRHRRAQESCSMQRAHLECHATEAGV